MAPAGDSEFTTYLLGMTDLEQDKYHELSAYTLTHPDPSFIHQYVVDAFAAQYADKSTRPITLAFALVGLYLHIDRNRTGKEVQRVHTLLARRRKDWPTFDLPEHRGDVTVCDVMNVAPGRERDAMIRNWSASVWEAYRASHDKVVELLKTELG